MKNLMGLFKVKHNTRDNILSPLEQLPEWLASEIASKIDKNSFANLRRASKTTLRLFHELSSAHKLLYHVERANYAAAAKMVEEHPMLMFQHVQ